MIELRTFAFCLFVDWMECLYFVVSLTNESDLYFVLYYTNESDLYFVLVYQIVYFSKEPVYVGLN